MELRHFRYVLAVAEELNFSRAAARLNMSQPPLSQQIRQIEEEIGTRLFHRTKRAVTLTEAGRAFVTGAREVLAHAERTAAAAVAASRGEIGELVVGTITSTDSEFYKAFVGVLRAFAARAPNVHLRLRQLNVQQQIDLLHAGQIHIGFVTLPVLDKRLMSLLVQRERLAVALPEHHPLTKRKTIPVQALESEGHVLMPRHSNPGYYDFLTGYFRSHGVSLRITDESDGLYTSLALVAAGRGVSVLPTSVLEVKRPGIVFRQFEGNPPMMEMGAVYLRDHAHPIIESFVAIARERGAARDGVTASRSGRIRRGT